MKVNFFAPINDLGYGIHSINTISEFEKRGHHITLIPPFGQVHKTSPHIERWLAAREHIEPNAPGIMIFNEDYLSQFSGRPRIGFPVFECEKFTPIQLAMMKTCDYIFTPSKWGATVLHDAGLKNISIVNEGFDPAVFQHLEKSTSDINDEPFTFVHVGKFEARKGTLQAIECFYQALEKENARLIMHVHNPFTSDYKAIHDTISGLGFTTANDGSTWRRAGLSVVFTQPMANQQTVYEQIYAKADCGLYPTRAEGWGLPILETIATGAPCIVGNWTGQSEYLTSEYPHGLTIRSPMRVPARDDMWFKGDRGNWNASTDGELIGLIRAVHSLGRSYRTTEQWQRQVRRIREFTWARAAEQLETAILEVCGM